MTTPEPSPVKKSFTTELTPEAKVQKLCELYGINPEVNRWEFTGPTGERWGWYSSRDGAETSSRREFPDHDPIITPVPDWPALTTDFLLRVARENGIDARVEQCGGTACFARVSRISDTSWQDAIMSDTPTEALYLALLRFRGEAI